MNNNSLIKKDETWDKLSQVLDFSKINFQGKNKNTEKSYLYSLKDFCKFLSEKLKISTNNKEIHSILINDVIKLGKENQLDPLSIKVYIAEYINYLIEKKQSTKTIAVKFAAIKDFFSSISDIYKVDLTNIKTPKIEKRKIKGPKPKEFEILIKNINNLFEKGSYSDKRNCLLFYLENFCGLRISEVLSIDIEQISFRESEIFVYRKGSAQYEKIPVSVPPATLEKLRQFVELDGRKKGPLFINCDKPHEPGRLSRQSAHKIFCDLTEKYLGKKFSPHKFRHFYSTEAWKLTKNKDLAMKFTGHKTSAIFDDYEEDEENHHLQIAQDLEKKWMK